MCYMCFPHSVAPGVIRLGESWQYSDWRYEGECDTGYSGVTADECGSEMAIDGIIYTSSIAEGEGAFWAVDLRAEYTDISITHNGPLEGGCEYQ